MLLCCTDLLLAPSLLLGGPAHPSVSAALAAAAWLTGEYCLHVRDPTAVLEALLQPNVQLLPASVQAIYCQVRARPRSEVRARSLSS